MGHTVRREWLLLTACLSVLAVFVGLDAWYGAELTLSGAYGLAPVLASMVVSLRHTVFCAVAAVAYAALSFLGTTTSARSTGACGSASPRSSPWQPWPSRHPENGASAG